MKNKESKREFIKDVFDVVENECIRNLRIFNTCPFRNSIILAVGASIATCILVPNEFRYNLNIKTEADSLGNHSVYEQYEDFESTTSKISFYSSWEKTKNGKFKRTVETYDLNSISEEKANYLLNNINSFDENTDLSEVLGKKPYKDILFASEVSEDELAKQEYYKLTIYDEDTNTYIVKEDKVGSVCLKFALIASLVQLFASIDLLRMVVKNKYTIADNLAHLIRSRF